MSTREVSHYVSRLYCKDCGNLADATSLEPDGRTEMPQWCTQCQMTTPHHVVRTVVVYRTLPPVPLAHLPDDGTNAKAATPDAMNDTALIKLLRERVTTLETAILDYHDAMERVGRPCKEAYEAAIVRPDAEKAADFLDAYQRTLTARATAAEALLAAVSTDFRTAVLTGADWTDEQRAYWLAACDQDAAVKAAAVIPQVDLRRTTAPLVDRTVAIYTPPTAKATLARGAPAPEGNA